MAYCKNCGAYIPDGLSACLACGFDETAPGAAAVKKRTEQNAAQAEDIRQVMDRHRKLQQEKNKQWAEKEKARREQQAENRRWAQEEYARRQAEREVEAEQRRLEREKLEQEKKERIKAAAATEAKHTVLRSVDEQAGAETKGEANSGNTAFAALSYLSILFIMPFIALPDDPFAGYHARQGIRLFVFSAIADLLSGTPIGWVMQLFRLFLIYKGMSNAVSGKKEPLPVIGKIGER